ncbi:UNVERIFIED_ORG: hypothetical protein ABIB21_002806 [Arthrobacter sp. UYEF13]
MAFGKAWRRITTRQHQCQDRKRQLYGAAPDLFARDEDVHGREKMAKSC